MNNKFKKGDLVYVIDWGKQYSNFYKWINGERNLLFNWTTEIPNYSDVSFHWKHIYEDNLTQKGTINKREPKKLVERIPIYKDFKYEIIEIISHPHAGEISFDAVEWYSNSCDKQNRKKAISSNNEYYPYFIYLIASTNNKKSWQQCFVQISEEGISKLTPKQFADEQFSALKEANLKKWTMEDDFKYFPKELMGTLYDNDQRVLFGSSMTKGVVTYSYIPKEYSKTGNPLFVCSEVLYDGKGCDLTDKKTVNWRDLPKMFPQTTFQN